MLESSALAPATPFRDRLPTLPYDLSEYARALTGPASVVADAPTGGLSAWPSDDPVHPTCADLSVDISPEDVPHVVLPPADIARFVSHREAFVVASIDGQSTLETIPRTLDLPCGEVVAIISSMCARGIVTLDRSGRQTGH